MEKGSLLAMLSTLALLIAAPGCAGKKPTHSNPMPGPELQPASGPTAAKPEASSKGFGKLISARKSAVASKTPAEDPLSLANRAEPNASLYTVMAQTHERSGNFQAAAQQYERALEVDPASLDAAIGYARMADRQGDFEQANRLYEQALERHPKNATVRNDYGLCLARQGELGRAAGMLQTACQLEPKETRYRNNLATVLVETQQYEEAYLQLSDVHEPAVAYYNVGYLLAQLKEYDAARHHFQQALRLKPGMSEASQWLASLPPADSRERMVQEAAPKQPWSPNTSTAEPRYGTPLK